MNRMEIRYASGDDIRRWYEESGKEYPGYSMRAVTAEHDGKLMGLAGVYYQRGAPPVAFSEMLPEMVNHKKVIVKVTRMVMAMIENKKNLTLAMCEGDNGKEFCKKLGFDVSHIVPGKGSVMVWKSCRTS